MTTIASATTYNPAAILAQLNARTSQAASDDSETAKTVPTTVASSAVSTKSLSEIFKAAANSGQFDFATVGQNARTVLDAGLQNYGQTPGAQTSEKDWIKIFGGMDRRSLYAASSNQGGAFSPQEQKVAKTLMDNQLANAGDTSASATTSAQIAGYGKQISYLNNASGEEKNSPAWAYSMADAQTAARMADINAHMPQPAHLRFSMC
jgi:hypothetical protein